MSLLMARTGRGFRPEGPDLLWTEAALHALDGDRMVSPSRQDEMLWAKYDEQW